MDLHKVIGSSIKYKGCIFYLQDINESGEQEDDDTNEDEPEDSIIDQEHEAEDNAEPGDEDEGAGRKLLD